MSGDVDVDLAVDGASNCACYGEETVEFRRKVSLRRKVLICRILELYA